MSLKDKSVLITGASMGIGAAIAHRLAREKATLILFARSEDKLQALTYEIQEKYRGVKVYKHSVDISSHEAVTNAIKTVVQELNGHPIDILINSNPSWAFLQVINACACPLLCRLENISSMAHIIPPFSSVFIGIDSLDLSTMANTPNNSQNLMNGSRFYLAQFPLNDNTTSLIQLMTNYFQETTSKKTQWSRPVRIDSQLEDVFLPIPGINRIPVLSISLLHLCLGLHDVLIRSVPVSISASLTLIIEPVHLQRSAKTTVK